MATPFTSFGYPETIEGGEWPIVAPVLAASPYGVEGGWFASPVPGVRQMRIGPGEGWGRGIYDTLAVQQTVEFTLVPNGSRFDLIALRRNWDTEESNLVVIPGGENPIIPAWPARKTYRADNQDDQPLWLVEVKANSTFGQIIDLRVWATTGGAVANHTAALQYLNAPGTQIRVGDAMWSRTFDALGGPKWVASTMDDTSWLPFAGVLNGFTASQEPDVILYYRRLNGVVHLRGSLRRAAATTDFTTALILPVGFRPSFPIWHQPRDGVTVVVLPGGAIQVLMNAPLIGGAAVALGGISFPVI